MLSAAFALIGLSSSPVFAGHWDTTTEYSGSTVNVSSGQTETLNWKDEGGPRNGSASAYPGSAGSTTINGTIKTTYTWVADPNIPDDKAPPEIWVDENATADWNADGSSLSTTTGTHSLSIGGTVTINTDNVLDTSTPHYSKSGKLGKHDVHKVPVLMDKAEVSCTLKTECHGGDGPTEEQSAKRNTSMYTSVTYRVEIIATPYDFKLKFIPYYTIADGYAFTYSWKSTTGNTSQLGHVTVYEHVEYPNGIIPPQKPGTYEPSAPTTFYPKNPPFNWTSDNPIDPIVYPNQTGGLKVSGTAAQMTDYHGAPSLVYGTGSFTANQEYRWHSSRIHKNATDHEVMDGLGAMHTIERSVVFSNSHYHYSVTKHGYTDGHDLP